ncbi:4-hydroxybenzoate octaprenyltransferase [Leptospira langatensis]|uniref:4-hydroxybenzoate polyprenyltransferase n=1 Tax=Leptospira langatensis TaxID=2484983 RepID=A0A5F1ZY35_9LEPT|nr:UbiA-like polyprenyltransferase [Leptospira langatensis]TGK04295.1 4-hydroxybenzoate octaprenyltransferase [Leptospira langatensis]TGL43775.1 4-hydroxybenzoate octaprenyltransferase [Leptospira langatensis]
MASSTLAAFAKYGRFIKFSHTLFALPFAGIAFVLAVLQKPSLPLSVLGLKLFWILICMVGARSAAMGFNRWADKRFDAKNPRTANREIPSGQISDLMAGIFIVGSSLLFFLGSWFLNDLSFYLSFPTLFLLFTYSYTKRFTFLCHFYLGVTIGLAPLATWIAIREEFSWMAGLWTLGLAFNLAGFDILYALQDREFDRKEGLHSVPAHFGEKISIIISRISHILSAVLLGLAAWYAGLHGIFWAFWLLIVAFLTWEQSIAYKSKDGNFPPLFYQIHSWISIVIFLGILLEKGQDLIQLLRQGSI